MSILGLKWKKGCYTQTEAPFIQLLISTPSKNCAPSQQITMNIQTFQTDWRKVLLNSKMTVQFSASPNQKQICDSL